MSNGHPPLVPGESLKEKCEYIRVDPEKKPMTPATFNRKRKRPPRFLSMAFIYAGNDLLSHTLSRAVQSALRGLTSVFGMGTGGSPAVRSPTYSGVCAARSTKADPRAETLSMCCEGSLYAKLSKILRTIPHN
jgi:hypothetical protein